VADFVRSHRRVYVVEQNRDAQLASLLKLDLESELVPRLRSVARLDGLPIDARSVTEDIAAKEAK
jgi:2-oxoglutarate ferredoxin oxidoreductase subunit alpha